MTFDVASGGTAWKTEMTRDFANTMRSFPHPLEPQLARTKWPKNNITHYP